MSENRCGKVGECVGLHVGFGKHRGPGAGAVAYPGRAHAAVGRAGEIPRMGRDHRDPVGILVEFGQRVGADVRVRLERRYVIDAQYLFYQRQQTTRLKGRASVLGAGIRQRNDLQIGVAEGCERVGGAGSRR